MKFSEDMIGKRVREISTGDEGTVIARRIYLDGAPLEDNRLYVSWDCDGELHILGTDVEFIGMDFTLSEITINGKRYKLVPIEEE